MKFFKKNNSNSKSTTDSIFLEKDSELNLKKSLNSFDQTVSTSLNILEDQKFDNYYADISHSYYEKSIANDIDESKKILELKNWIDDDLNNVDDYKLDEDEIIDEESIETQFLDGEIIEEKVVNEFEHYNDDEIAEYIFYEIDELDKTAYYDILNEVGDSN